MLVSCFFDLLIMSSCFAAIKAWMCASEDGDARRPVHHFFPENEE